MESGNPPSLGGSGATAAETGDFNREINEIRESGKAEIYRGQNLDWAITQMGELAKRGKGVESE